MFEKKFFFGHTGTVQNGCGAVSYRPTTNMQFGNKIVHFGANNLQFWYIPQDVMQFD